MRPKRAFKIKSFFHHFQRTFTCQKLYQTWYCYLQVMSPLITALINCIFENLYSYNFSFFKNHHSERFRRIHWKIIAIQLQTCCCTKKKNLITSVFQIILQIILEQLFCRWPADAYFYFWLTHWSLFIPPENIRKTLFFLYFQGLLNKTSSMKWINPFVPKHPRRFK